MFELFGRFRCWCGSFAFFVREALAVAIRIGLLLVFVGLILATAFLVLACVARIQVSYAQLSGAPAMNLAIFRWFAQVLNSATGIDLAGASAPQQRDFAAGFSDLAITSFALVLAILSFGQFLRDNILTRGSSLIRNHRLHPNGEPRIMQRYYKTASALTLISGDFSFIQNNAPLLATLRRLRDQSRLWLVSHKTQQQVAVAMGANFAEFEETFRFNHPHHIHCSIVQYPTGRVFLYREHHEDPGEQPRAFIYAIRERARSHALLRALSTLTGHSENVGDHEPD